MHKDTRDGVSQRQWGLKAEVPSCWVFILILALENHLMQSLLLTSGWFLLLSTATYLLSKPLRKHRFAKMPSTRVKSAGIEVASQTSGTSRRSGLGKHKAHTNPTVSIFLPLPPT